jgi:mono/diheme cytochrome c family protein
MMLALSAPQKFGAAFAIVLVVGWFAFIVAHVKRSDLKAGSELEYAANRKEYFDDEELEGPRLERVQVLALLTLAFIAIGLPLYWLREPSRQAGATTGFGERAAGRGFLLFQPADSPLPTHNVGHFGCATCHGLKGEGGATNYAITTPLGETKQVQWKAPALNTVLLRYTPDTVRTILIYGRQNTPMPAWGVQGGGAMNEQQIEDLVAYLQSIQIKPEDAKKEAAQYGLNGAKIFDAYCARCHTRGWSFGEPDVTGGGAYGPNLTGGSETRQFPDVADHEKFVSDGAEYGKPYGLRGIGNLAPVRQPGADPGAAWPGGGMPFFSNMLTPEQIKAVVAYERSL